MRIQSIPPLLRYYGSFLQPDVAKIRLGLGGAAPGGNDFHLDAAAEWICRAQDAHPGGGVARSYSLVYNPYFGRRGWIPPYPETTGYIIPTMFDYAHRSGRQEAFERAVRMAEWECEVQMASGAVQGGTVDQAPTPAIFNTGQVIFGWIRAFQETGRERFLESATRAGGFLLESQAADGAWRKHLSEYASSTMASYTYNTRTAWALLLLSTVTGEPRFREAAVRNIDHALGQQLENGWFASNCLYDPARPLLHTIAYAIRGVMECGAILDNREYLAGARKAADALLGQVREDGSLAGCFDDRWQPAASWSCLTGDAQIAHIWGRLCQITGEEKYREGARRTIDFLKRVQLLATEDPGIRGGIGGSDPISGRYGRYEILNWAVKFFMDALMIDASLAEREAR